MNVTFPASLDLIVIGGGPAGYSAAIRAAQFGNSVLLVEKERLGGACLNSGCIPTKFLWETLNLEKKIKRAADHGFAHVPARPEFSLVQQKKNKAIDIIGHGLQNLLASYPITIIEGTAHFTGHRQVAITTRDGAITEAQASKIIIATGSRPRDIPELGIDPIRIINSDDALRLGGVPKTMAIIGAGAIGVEFAFIFAGFGCDVTLIEKESHILPAEDGELSSEVKKLLQRQGVKVIESAGTLEPLIRDAEQVLVATGRQPNIETLNLPAAKINFNENGITVNAYLETSQNGVYACGDVTGKNYLAYIAQAEGIAAAENIHGGKNTIDYSTTPRVIFSQPPIASAGKRPKDCDPAEVIAGRFPFTANSRAFIEGERTGWVKVLVEKKTGLIAGCQVIGAEAEALISIISMALKRKTTVNDLKREMFFHPSMAESIFGACEDAFNKCIDLPNKI